MHRAESNPGERRFGELALSLLSALVAAVMVVASVRASPGDDVTVVVPNAFTCSQTNDTCRQTNPPYAPAAPSQCTWTATVIPAGTPAERVC